MIMKSDHKEDSTIMDIEVEAFKSDEVILQVPPLVESPSTGDLNTVNKLATNGEKLINPKSCNARSIPKAPDGGFGWAVVFASFMCNVIVDGIIFSFGILLPEISSEFEVNKATTAWIGSLQTGFYLIVGPVVSALAQRFDCRSISIIGSVLAALGFITSFFAPNVLTLYVTFGLLSGIGFGFIFLPAIVTVGYYFEKRRAFATGIAVCGSGIGNFVLPPIIQLLINQFGWRYTVLFLSAITITCALFGSLFRPIMSMSQEVECQNPPPAEEVIQKPLLMRIKEARAAQWAQSTETLNEDSPTGSQNSAPPPYSEVLNIIQLAETNLPLGKPSRSDSCKKSEENLYRRRAKSALERKASKGRDEMLYSNLSLVILPQSRSISNLSQMGGELDLNNQTEPGMSALDTVENSFLSGFDLSLLKRPSFVLLASSGFLCLVGFFIPFIYLSDRAKLLGCSPERCALILSMIGVTNTFGRVICGWASDNRVNALLLNNIAVTIGGIATILSPILFNSFVTLIIYGAVFGFSVASFATLRSVITVELLGLEKLTSAFGLLLLFQGLAVTIGSPIAGSYDYSFYLAGSAIALSGIMCYPLNAIARWEKKLYEESTSTSESNEMVDVKA